MSNDFRLTSYMYIKTRHKGDL